MLTTRASDNTDDREDKNAMNANKNVQATRVVVVALL